MYIYNAPHKQRIREGNFVQFLRESFPNAEFVPKNYSIDEKFYEYLVNTEKVITCLELDVKLSKKKRDQCIAHLKRCPKNLRVAIDPSRIFFDVVIEENGMAYFWEYHERQHRQLKGTRIKKLFSPDQEPIGVPRYLQRFIRDIWKIQNFRPYTIVWDSWFQENSNIYIPKLGKGFQEFYNDHMFSFTQFFSL